MSADELKDFGRWLRSPWCNSNKNLPRLLDQLIKYYPNFDSSKLTKEKVFEQILPNGKYSDRRMNNLMSEGYLAGERFLAFQNLENNSQLQTDLLSKEFQNRLIDQWFYKSTYQIIEKKEAIRIKNWKEHLDLFRLYRRLYHHPNQDPRMQSGKKNIVRMGEELDWVYLLEKAAIINEKIFRNRILQNENHNTELEIKKWKALSEGINHPVITLYQKRFEYSEQQMLSQFIDLQNYFFDHFSHLNFKEQQSQLHALLNDAFYLRKKRLYTLSEIFLLYKFGFKHNLFLLDGVITRITYTTAVMISNSLEDFDYSLYIIDTYSKYLSEEIQRDAIKWAMAHTLSKQKSFEKCLDTLLSHDFRASYFRRVTRVLTLQTYFELYLIKPDSYHEYLLSYCHAFEKWIQRERTLSTLLKESYFQFIQKCRMMVKIYSDIEFSEKELEKVFYNTKNIEAYDWLLEKKEQIILLKTNEKL